MHFDEIPFFLDGSVFSGQLGALRKDTLGVLDRVSESRQDLVRIRVPGGAIGVVNAPETVHDVLVAKAKSFEKSPVLRLALEPLAGKGLFTSEGDLWRRQRRLMAPLFQPTQIDGYATCMRECAERVGSELVDGETTDIAHETMRVAMSIAGKALFDADTFGDADELGAAITIALAWVNDGAMSFELLAQSQLRTAVAHAERVPAALEGLRARATAVLEKPVLWPGARSRKLRAALDVLDRRVARMIAERRETTLERSDLLTRLLQARDEDDGARMSDKQVRDEILTLFIAGHETTATSLAWSLYFLANDPALYAKARAEVSALEGRPVTLADLPRLGFLLRVFKEAMRIYPPIYLFGRQAIADVEVGRWHIPRSTILLVSPYTVQRRGDVWPQPERFDPERFTPEAEASRERGAYVPFSAGPRTCIGSHFALIEGPIVLATLLQRADFELATRAPIVPEASATLRPKGGMPMRVTLRARG